MDFGSVLDGVIELMAKEEKTKLSVRLAHIQQKHLEEFLEKLPASDALEPVLLSRDSVLPWSTTPKLVTDVECQKGSAKVQCTLGETSSMQNKRVLVWSGYLEWRKHVNGQRTRSPLLVCEAYYMCNNEVEVEVAHDWPQVMVTQLIPNVIVDLLQPFMICAKAVQFVIEPSEVATSLARAMESGYSACLHLNGWGIYSTGLVILIYSKERQSFMGFNPVYQQEFMEAFFAVIDSQKHQIFKKKQLIAAATLATTATLCEERLTGMEIAKPEGSGSNEIQPFYVIGNNNWQQQPQLQRIPLPQLVIQDNIQDGVSQMEHELGSAIYGELNHPHRELQGGILDDMEVMDTQEPVSQPLQGPVVLDVLEGLQKQRLVQKNREQLYL